MASDKKPSALSVMNRRIRYKVHTTIVYVNIWFIPIWSYGSYGPSQQNTTDLVFVKGELRPEISLLHMIVLTLTKAKSNDFL